MFLQNERGLGVKNGTLGTVEQVSARSMSVRTDDGRSVSFDLKDYDRIDHGYAATIHKAQGMTVDRTHVLATPGLDAHGSYVALSRHRDGMDLHYGRDDFADENRLVRTLSRDRAKDMASDYEADRPGTGLCRAARHHLPRARRRDRAQAVAGKRPRQDRWIAGGSALPRRRCARRGRRAATGKGKCREGGGPRHRNRGAGTGNRSRGSIAPRPQGSARAPRSRLRCDP